VIHKTAIIDANAELADDIKIGPYSIVGAGVKIDAGCEIKSHVVLAGNTTIGKNNRIFQFASVGDEPQDKKYNNEDTRLIIGDGNTIRESVTINRGTVDDTGVTRIGNDNWIMAYVHIAHDCQIGHHNIMANCTSLAGHVHIADYVILGGFTKLHQFCRVGSYAFTAMDSGFQKDVPPFVMAQGNPAEPRAINFEGLKRRGFSKPQIDNIKKAYRLLYKSNLTLEDALLQMTDIAESSTEVQMMIDFIKASNRSIIR